MNKLFTKIATLSVGLAMAIGVGVAIGSGSKAATKVEAATSELTFNVSSNPGGWPTTNSTTETPYNYTLNSKTYVFTLKNVKQNSGYLMLTSTAALGLPALSDAKLTKVVAHNSSGCSTSTRVGISSSSSSASYITGGAYQTYSSTNSNYTYNLSGTSNNTRYYIYVTNKNCQLTSITLTYEVEESSKTATTTTVSATSTSLSIGGTTTLSATVSYTGGTVSSPSITYSSNDTDVATVSGNTVTAVAPGTVTITGTYAGDNTYEGSTGTVSITVSEQSYSGTFSLYSGDITEGDYVLVYSGHAVKSKVVSNRLDCPEVTVTSDQIVNPGVSLVWHIVQNGDYWTLYNASTSKYAASNGSKNQATLDSSVSDNAKWTITGDSTYEFENLGRSTGSDPNNKWLRYNAGYGFACYASSTGGALTLYKAPIAVTGVSVSPTSTALVVGNSQQLTATVTPANATNKSVTWKSYSNSECTIESSAVASVSNTGNVTAISAGTAYIQVKTVDGNHTAKCTVTVTAGTVSVTGVSVSPTSTSLVAGGTQQLTPTVTPANATNKSVTYSSNANSVATVSNTGLITAVAPGNATITVTTVDGGFTATCTVTVNTVSVTGVTVDPTSVTLSTGGTQQLTPTVTPANATNKSVTYSSNANSVATVSNTGLITAVAHGSATITVTTADGGFTATCTVTVLNLGSVTFVAATDGASGTSFTKGGITLEASNGSFSETDYRIYKGATLTISCSLGNIVSLSFTFTDTSNNGKWSSGNTYYEENINDSTWSKTAQSGSSGAQARITELVVVYELGETFTISYNANGGDGTMEDTVGTAPQVAQCSFDPPSESGKVFLKWNTAADGTGDDYHPGDVVEDDLELYAIWSLPVGGDIILTPSAHIITTTSKTKDAAKCGTGKAGGSTDLLVKKSGISKIKVYIAAWSSDSPTVSVSVSSGTISPTSVTPTSDAGISGSTTTFTLDKSESTYRQEFTLTNVPADATITFSTSSANNRFVLWGPTDLFAVSFADTFLSKLQCNSSGTSAPTFIDDYSWSDFEAIYDNLDEEEQGILHDANAVEHVSPSTDTEKIEASMARYDYIVGKYNPTDSSSSPWKNFIGRTVTPIGYQRVLIDVVSKNSVNTVAIVVVVSVLALLGVGGYFYLRKKKED